MTTLFDAQLLSREYASNLLHVAELLDWVKSKRLHLRTKPPIDGTEFVQVEALLGGIERHAGDVTLEQALEIVLYDPVLKNDPVFLKYSDLIDPRICRWLIGAEAARKWREILSAAITAHELTLLDFGSKLPVKTTPEQANTAPTVEVLPKQRAQENRILELLVENGYDPVNLAKRWPGKAGPKAEIRTLTMTEPKLFTEKSFEKAWERLRNEGSIDGAE